MILRIRLTAGPRVALRTGKNRPLALAVGGLLIPMSLMAYALAGLCLAADLRLVHQMAAGTIYAHWQVWMAGAVALNLFAIALNRYGCGDEFLFPRLPALRPALGRRVVLPFDAKSPETISRPDVLTAGVNLTDGISARTSAGASSR
jgi:hypothetical protein